MNMDPVSFIRTFAEHKFKVLDLSEELIEFQREAARIVDIYEQGNRGMRGELEISHAIKRLEHEERSAIFHGAIAYAVRVSAQIAVLEWVVGKVQHLPIGQRQE